MNIFLQHLNSPEYMHVLLNPVPVYGLAIGVVGLLLAVIARNRTGIVIALVLVFLSGLSAWPTHHYREAGYDRNACHRMCDTWYRLLHRLCRRPCATQGVSVRTATASARGTPPRS